MGNKIFRGSKEDFIALFVIMFHLQDHDPEQTQTGKQ